MSPDFFTVETAKERVYKKRGGFEASKKKEMWGRRKNNCHPLTVYKNGPGTKKEQTKKCGKTIKQVFLEFLTGGSPREVKKWGTN